MSNEIPELEKPRKPLKAKLRLGAIIFVSIFFAGLALANLGEASVNLLFAQVSMPLFLLLIGVFGLGAAAGWLVRGGRKKG